MATGRINQVTTLVNAEPSRKRRPERPIDRRGAARVSFSFQHSNGSRSVKQPTNFLLRTNKCYPSSGALIAWKMKINKTPYSAAGSRALKNANGTRPPNSQSANTSYPEVLAKQGFAEQKANGGKILALFLF